MPDIYSLRRTRYVLCRAALRTACTLALLSTTSAGLAASPDGQDPSGPTGAAGEPSTSSATGQEPASRTASTDHTWMAHLCRLDVDAAEAAATTEEERILVQEWRSYLQEAQVDVDRLAEVSGPTVKAWKDRLLFSFAQSANRPAVTWPVDPPNPLQFAMRKAGPMRWSGPSETTVAYAEGINGTGFIQVSWGGRTEWMAFYPGQNWNIIHPDIAGDARPIDGFGEDGLSLTADDGHGQRRSTQPVLGTLGLGTASVEPVLASILDMSTSWRSVLVRGFPPARGGLGWPVIGVLRWEIDRRADEARVVKPSAEPRGSARNLWYVGHPVVRVTIDGRPGLAALRLGYASSELTAFGVQRLGLEQRRRMRRDGVAFGTAVSRRLRRRATVSIGDADVRVRWAEVREQSPEDGVCVDAIVGYDMLRRHNTMLLDGPGGYVRFGPPVEE